MWRGKMHKKVFGILIVVFGLFSILYTPIESRFIMHVGEIDLRISLLDVTISLTKKQHILSFGILSILLLNHLLYEKSRYLKVFLWIFGFSVLVEGIQIFFVQGHFRLRDLISNIVGIVFSIFMFKRLEKHLKKASGLKTVLINMIIITVHILFTITVYYVFKEISVMLGGESLRKYLEDSHIHQDII